MQPSVNITERKVKANGNKEIRIISNSKTYKAPMWKCGLEATPPMPKYMREQLEKEKKENNND